MHKVRGEIRALFAAIFDRSLPLAARNLPFASVAPWMVRTRAAGGELRVWQHWRRLVFQSCELRLRARDERFAADARDEESPLTAEIDFGVGEFGVIARGGGGYRGFGSRIGA